MFNINGKLTKEFSKIYEQTRLIRSSTDIFFQNIRILHFMKTKYITQDIYNEYYDSILADVELKSSPIDIVIPNMTEYPEVDGQMQIPDDYQICVLNDVCPEYEKISKRVTVDDIKNTLEPTSAPYAAVVDNPENIKTIIDEIFKFWLIRRFFVQIEMLHLSQLGQMTPIIEYVVNNVTLKDIKNHINSNKVNMEKAVPLIKESIFQPDLGRINAFYQEGTKHCPSFEAKLLIEKLASNLTLNSDIYIISAIYHTLSFAMNDFARHSEEEGEVELTPCEKYVVEVLSQI